MKNDYYTYAYLRKDGTPYYIGKGRGYRAFHRGNRKGAPTPRDKSQIIFLKTELTEEEAFKHERYMIAVLGRKDLGTGILRNLTDGGDGVHNLHEEAKTKMREGAKRGSQSAKLKLQKAVELTQIADGKVFLFDSVIDAARAKNLDVGTLCKVCNGQFRHTRGFLARYWTQDAFDWGEGLFREVNKIAQERKEKWKKIGPNARKAAKAKLQKPLTVTRISDGNIFVFHSVGDAARALNLDSSSLSKVCRGQLKSLRGYTARYLTPPSAEPYENSNLA